MACCPLVSNLKMLSWFNFFTLYDCRQRVRYWREVHLPRGRGRVCRLLRRQPRRGAAGEYWPVIGHQQTQYYMLWLVTSIHNTMLWFVPRPRSPPESAASRRECGPAGSTEQSLSSSSSSSAIYLYLFSCIICGKYIFQLHNNLVTYFIIVKLREREGHRVDLGRSLKRSFIDGGL